MPTNAAMQPRVGGAPAAEPEFAGLVHTVTWNIQFGIGAESAATAMLHHDTLRGADVLLLQEMDEAGTALIAERVGMHYVFASASPHRKSGRDFGNAILSPWPITNPVVVDLPHKSAVQGQPRNAVRATVTIGPHDIDTCSVHTEVPTLSSSKRIAQVETVASATATGASGLLIIGGDFNTVSRRGTQAAVERFAAIGATRVSDGAGPTLRRGGREFTLDHVFARGLQPVATGVVAGLDASDHRPLWVRVRPS